MSSRHFRIQFSSNVFVLAVSAVLSSACQPQAIDGYFTQAPKALVASVPTVGPTPQPTIVDPGPPPNSDLCVEHPEADACKKAPVVTTPGVVTILFTMSQIPQDSATLILANAIKYASPVANPKILFLKDRNTGGEDEGDPDYIKSELLLGYDLEYGVVPSGGLTEAAVAGKDLVLISNPGHPLSDKTTQDTLLAFKGGVILLGDDMTMGSGFSQEPLTGLKNVSNGTSISCGGTSYGIDNNSGYNYQITLNEEFMPGLPAEHKHYEYGNDIDHATLLNPDVQVLAWAAAPTGTCDIGNIPAVVRYPRPAPSPSPSPSATP